MEISRLGSIDIKEKIKILAEIESKKRMLYAREYLPRKGEQIHQKRGKWCNLHRTDSHNNSECFTQRKDKHKIETKDRTEKIKSLNQKERFAILKEDNKAPARLIFKGKIEEQDVDFLIDSGATKNYMSYELAKTLNLNNNLEVYKKDISLANGDRILSKGIAKANINFLQIPNTIFKSEFVVIDSSLTEIALGTKFLGENGVMIDFDYGLVRIDGRTVEMPMHGADRNGSPETLLIDSYKSINIRDELKKTVREFTLKNPLIGNIKGHKLKIDVTEEAPVKGKIYSIPYGLYDKTKEEIKKLESQGIIRRSTSRYSSPCFVLEKKNHEIRLITDFRELNLKIKEDIFPFPAIEDQLRGLKDAVIFSQIDLQKGFYQLDIDENDREKTAFTLPMGHYEYCKVPLGLINSPKFFQRVMQEILDGIKNIRIFMDDILIFGKNEQEHFQTVKTVLTKLHNEGARINYEKSKFGVHEVKFLGMIIDKNGIKPETSKLELYINEDPPRTLKKLQRFVGILNWYRRFLPNLSSKISKITDKLCGKGKIIEWDTEDEKIRQEILQEINKGICIYHADLNVPFTLQTDASDIGIGAILLQNHKIVGVYSKKLSGPEKNYTTPEKEIFAIIKALEHFKNLIWCSKIFIETDSKNISYLNCAENSRARRWQLLLNMYNISIKHIPGEENIGADLLSRNYGLTEVEEIAWFKAILSGIKNMLIDEKEIENNKLSKDTHTELYLTEDKRVYIPERSTSEFLIKLHNELLHVGISRLYQSIKKYFYIHNLKNEITKVCENCLDCKQNKIKKVQYGELKGCMIQMNL